MQLILAFFALLSSVSCVEDQKTVHLHKFMINDVDTKKALADSVQKVAAELVQKSSDAVRTLSDEVPDAKSTPDAFLVPSARRALAAPETQDGKTGEAARDPILTSGEDKVASAIALGKSEKADEDSMVQTTAQGTGVSRKQREAQKVEPDHIADHYAATQHEVLPSSAVETDEESDLAQERASESSFLEKKPDEKKPEEKADGAAAKPEEKKAADGAAAKPEEKKADEAAAKSEDKPAAAAEGGKSGSSETNPLFSTLAFAALVSSALMQF